MGMMPRGWTIGTELELSDCRRDTYLPGLSQWDRDDYTIVNSNGVANDPRGITWPFGGEINTEPTSSIDRQVDVIDRVFSSLSPTPTVNYRSNLHVHVHVPGLKDDLQKVKRAIAYTATWGWQAFELVDPMPPRPESTDRSGEYKGARTRWNRRARSHHAMWTNGQLQAIERAASVEEVREAHASKDKRGRPQYHLAQRTAVNFRGLWENQASTIEFRHFCLSLNLDEIRNAMRWCVGFLAEAIEGSRAPSELLWVGATFPMNPLYDHWLETRYRATSIRYHDRDTIRATLRRWKDEGTL